MSSSNDKLSQFVFKLLGLVCRADDFKRQEFLRTACDLTNDQDAIALLWLYDKKHEYIRLDRHFSRIAIPESEKYLFRRTLFLPDTNAKVDANFDHYVGLSRHPEIAVWAGQQLPLVKEKLFPVIGSGDQLVGILQLLSSVPLAEQVSMLMLYLTDSLARAIQRGRERRRLEVARQMREELADILAPTQNWFDATARVLKENIRAETCLIFRQQSDLGFECVASSPTIDASYGAKAGPKSLIKQIAQSGFVVRMRDHYDENERRHIFGTVDYDTALLSTIENHMQSRFRSWMASPVMVANHSIAVIVLINKQLHYAQEFSETDEEVLRDVCNLLANALPGVETFRSIRAIAGTVLPENLTSPGSRAKIFCLLQEMIPGTVGAALYDPVQVSDDIYSPHDNVYHLGGEELIRGNVVPSAIGRVEAFANQRQGSQCSHYYAIRVDASPGSDSKLLLGLARGYLAEYERQLLDYVGAELAQLLRALHLGRQHLHDIAQLRHAIRSGLNGVNHIEVALGCLRLYRRGRRTSSIFDTSRFRKSLERATLFARKTQILLEESRFLLGQIKRDSLRVGGGSLRHMINEVVLCLAPDAELRNVTVRVIESRAAHETPITCDLQLVDMLLFNIVDNAIKYSFRDQEVWIEIDTVSSFYRIAVTDLGVHIKPQDFLAIFERFTRRPTGEASTTRPGTGLGLPVAQAVANAHGGKIEVVSRVVRNEPHVMAETKFLIYLPKTLRKEGKSNG